MILKDKLIYIRNKVGLDQESFGINILGLPEGTAQSRISQYENGIYTPRMPVLIKYASAINKDITWLTDDTLIPEDTTETKYNYHIELMSLISRIIEGYIAEEQMSKMTQDIKIKCIDFMYKKYATDLDDELKSHKGIDIAKKFKFYEKDIKDWLGVIFKLNLI